MEAKHLWMTYDAFEFRCNAYGLHSLEDQLAGICEHMVDELEFYEGSFDPVSDQQVYVRQLRGDRPYIVCDDCWEQVKRYGTF